MTLLRQQGQACRSWWQRGSPWWSVLGGRARMLLSTGLQVGMLSGTAMLKWVTYSFGEWQVRCELALYYCF